MVAAISTPLNPKTADEGDPPLFPSQPENNALAPPKFKPHEVTSRYMSSSSTSRRCESPLVSRTLNSPAKRSQSIERRRPSTPGSQKMVLTTTTRRSLSVSFQGESFWITVSKAKPATSTVKAITNPKLVALRKSASDAPPRLVVNSRGQVSTLRPASPNKLPTLSSSRGISPSPVRNAVSSTSNSGLGLDGNQPSILSFAVNVQRGRVGENRILDAHLMRLLYNRLLQWRFVNARAHAHISLHRLNAEKCLCDAWVSIFKLRESVGAKRTQLQLLKQHLKLISILKEQIIHLEDWAILDPVYSSSLSGAIEALKASTLRLPVVGGAKVDVLKVNDAICSAVNVMQTMASSVCLLSSKVRECSLRTHLSQLKCLLEAQQ